MNFQKFYAGIFVVSFCLKAKLNLTTYLIAVVFLYLILPYMDSAHVFDARGMTLWHKKQLVKILMPRSFFLRQLHSWQGVNWLRHFNSLVVFVLVLFCIVIYITYINSQKRNSSNEYQKKNELNIC